MRYADEFSDFTRFEEPIRTLLEGVVFNSQRWQEDQDDAPLVADAIKYHSRPVERPNRKPYPEPGDEDYDEYVGTILRDILGFDAVTRFQETCWRELQDIRQQRAANDQTQGAILSAPTGFGKTEGFAGPILHDLAANGGDGFGKSVIVYPRNALLEDQLERFLVHIHRLNESTQFDSNISIGIYNGQVPRQSEHIDWRLTNDDNEFSMAQWTGRDDPVPLRFEYTSYPDEYELRAGEDVRFDTSTLKLSREASLPNKGGEVPDILLTTINSLENFGLKPNYNLIDDFRTFIFDEIYLYTETYGSHASNIINNAKDSIRKRGASDDGMVFIGSSATIDRPKSLGSELFGIDRGDVRVIETGPEDKLATDDTEHFHFVASDQDLGTSSTFIQQILLFSHALLDEHDAAERKKALAFIDSISQVNQRYFQIQDFEQEDRWSFHDQDQDDWEAVATETPYRTALPEETAAGHELIEEDLEIERTSSDRRLSADEFGDTDLILSTSLLEVGIDIPAIKIVSQYRAPWEMSQFVQRIGRASRQEGSDAHFLITLGEDATDRSLFQRAERFLEPEIDTPLDSDNEILQWTHNQIYRAFETAYDIRNTREYIEDSQLEFLERFLGNSSEDSLVDFYDFAENPRRQMQAYLQRQVDETGPLWTTDGLQSAYDVLDEAMSAQELTSIARLLGTSATRYTLQVTDIESIDEDVHEGIVDRVNDVLTYLDDLQPTSDTVEDTLTEIREELESLPETMQREDLERRHRLDQAGDTLDTVQRRLRGIADELDNTADDFPFNLGLNEAADAVGEARELREQEELVTRRRVWQRSYHLQRSLEELYCFVNQEIDGHVYGYMMVRAYKSLLRAVYFHHRAEIIGEPRGELEPPFYVATSYFGDAGETFSVISDDAGERANQPETVDSLYQRRYESSDEDAEQTEVSLTKLFYEYAPYMNKYLENQSIQLFNPTVNPTPDHPSFGYHFDLQSFQTEPNQDVITPVTLPVKQVRDHSGNRAQSIVRYCNRCLDVKQGFEQTCSTQDCDGDIRYGRLRSNPQIDTSFEPEVAPDDNLGVSYIDADVRLEAVTLNITSASPNGDPTSGNSTPFSMDYENPRVERIGFHNPLGFSLKTRGVTWDISAFLDTVQADDELVARFNRLNPENDLEEVVHYTAAHFLLGLVSDVTGVNQSQLLYGMDEERTEVAVFERAEGGQGVVDLFNRVRNQTNHERLLEAINRVATNAQLINGRLWANEEFMQAVLDGDHDTVEALIQDEVPVPTETVINNVREVTRSTADQLREFETVTGVGKERAYELRQEAARLQFVEGSSDPVEALLSEHGVDIPETAVRNFLVEPDVDGCVENLQLKYSIVAGDQSDVLSYLVLQRLQEEIVDSADGEWGEAMVDNGAIPGANINGTNIFHSL
jgi:ATP-dependent helicase YprA (DUF1998 family)